jgi:ribosome biogenesis SPOUT family RNA methylase Rps3
VGVVQTDFSNRAKRAPMLVKHKNEFPFFLPFMIIDKIDNRKDQEHGVKTAPNIIMAGKTDTMAIETTKTIMAGRTDKKINTNLRFCQICYVMPTKISDLIKHRKTHTENKNYSKLKITIMNESRIKLIYNKLDNNGKFIIINRILQNLKNEKNILSKNYVLLQNA